MKKLLGKMLLISLAGGLLPLGLGAQAASFNDVGANHQHYPAIEYLKVKGVIKGYEDGTFKPEQTINRAEALKILFIGRDVLKKADQNSNSEQMAFADVKSSDWFFDYVKRGFQTTIVEGYEDGTFKPANPINVAESLKIATVGLNGDIADSSGEKVIFEDVKNSDWYFKYVEFLLNKQVLEPTEDLNLRAGENITRGEFAEVIYRLMLAGENNLDKFPLSQNWPACNNFTAGYRLKYPQDWEKSSYNGQFVLWKQDKANGQVSFARVYPDSASLVIAVDENASKLKLADYLNGIEYEEGASKQFLDLNGLPYGSVTLASSGLRDSYFEMPDGKILVIYGQSGDGVLSAYLNEQIRYILGSVRASSAANEETNCLSAGANQVYEDEEKLLSEVRKLLLVKGEGAKALEMLGESIVIETDTIGIGTGPIDYYYSGQLDITLKYERDSKTALALKEGRVSNF
ncbi:MAG: S-layer homology domain-containing protein [Candidatus Altimarinota bacterium]